MAFLRRLFRRSWLGALAQLGEHLLCKQGVIGSIPIGSTISNSRDEDNIFREGLWALVVAQTEAGLFFDIVNGFFNRCRGCIVAVPQGIVRVANHTFIFK